MRAFLVSALTLSLATPAVSAQMLDNAAELHRTEALQNAGHDNWKGRHHYLYDDEYRPETTGSAPRAKGCTEEAVRTRSSDGKTVIQRINRCN